MPSFNVKAYSVKITNSADPFTYIMLFDDEHASKSRYRARLNFSQLQETATYSMTVNGTFIQVSMNYKTFASTVDLLRNEKPISFNWFPASKVCILATSEEPVGEGEV